jgi:hypothetical protein
VTGARLAALRAAGIRTATDLLCTFSREVSGGRVFVRPSGVDPVPLPESRLRLLVRVLAAEPGLASVWNWQRNGVRQRACRPEPEA